MAIGQPDPVVLPQSISTSIDRDVAPVTISILPSKFGYKASEVILKAGIGTLTNDIDPDTGWKLFVPNAEQVVFAGTIQELEAVIAQGVEGHVLTQEQADTLLASFLQPYVTLVQGFNSIVSIRQALGQINLTPKVSVSVG